MIQQFLRTLGIRTVISLLGIGLGTTQWAATQQNQPLLQITSPPDGTIVSPGQTVTVAVTPASGIVFTQIIAAAENPIGFSSVATSSPFQMYLTIPSSITPGIYHITALGSTGLGSPVESASVAVDVERPDTPSLLTSQVPKITFDSQGEQLPLEIDATFGDGTVLEVTSSTNMTYSVQGSRVASVDSMGIITAISPGATAITANYTQNSKSLQLTIPVVVPPPPVSLAPATLAFANQALGSTSAAQTIQLTNTSGTILSVKAIATTGDFSETDNCLSSSSLANGGSCSITVRFSPTANGIRSGTLSIGHSRGISSLEVPISGTGVGPAAQLSTTSLSFNNQQLGASSPAQTLVLTNTGASGLAVSSIVAPIGFSESDTCLVSSPIAPAASCSINIAFAPTSLGITDGTLAINDNANAFSQSVFLVGNGIDTIPPVISISTNPPTLWPPNGKTVQVTVSGAITDSGSGVNTGSASFAVADSEGGVQPSGAIKLGADGTYSFAVPLIASRQGSDKGGRQYTITVAAQDNAGNVGSGSAVVTVPHDQGH